MTEIQVAGLAFSVLCNIVLATYMLVTRYQLKVTMESLITMMGVYSKRFPHG